MSSDSKQDRWDRLAEGITGKYAYGMLREDHARLTDKIAAILRRVAKKR